MKHVVTITTSNPSHEHVSLRRRQSTTNFMVEAANEEQAVLRASAHFRRLGHYIHEAKIFKKKEQLNELTSNSAFIDDSAAKAGLKRNPGESDADLVKRITAAKGIHDKGAEAVYPELALIGGAGMRAANVLKGAAGQAGSAIFDKIMKSSKDVETGLGNLGTAIVDKGTSAGKVVRDEIASHIASLPINLGITAATNAATGKETNLGSIVKDKSFWADYANTPGLSLGSRVMNLQRGAGKVAGEVADEVSDVASAVSQKTKDLISAALARARTKGLTPGKIDLPSRGPEREPYIELEPAVAPKVEPEVKPNLPSVRTDVPVVIPPKVMPSVRPEVKPEVKPQPSVKPEVKGKIEIDTKTKVEPEMTTGVKPKPEIKTTPRTKVETKPRPEVKRPRVSISPYGYGEGPDVDPGTLGQYRGLFPLYRFAEFENIKENTAMNAVGRVLAKRNKADKQNSESEKNKINMEPKLNGGKA